MISDKSRAWWFGASDASYIVGNWNTDSFKKWWLEKLDLRRNTFSSKAMNAGTHFEHRILDTIEGVRKDHQIIIPDLRLRVNYDGDKDRTIYEVKTHKDEFKVTKAYWRQAQVEMFAYPTTELYILSYQLTEEDYRNYFMPIGPDRMQHHKVEYDKEFIDDTYLPDLKELCKFMSRKQMPVRKRE